MHEEAFRQLGGVPEEILYDRSISAEIYSKDPVFGPLE
jgi:transposase